MANLTLRLRSAKYSTVPLFDTARDFIANAEFPHLIGICNHSMALRTFNHKYMPNDIMV